MYGQIGGILQAIDSNQVKAEGKRPITSTQTTEKKTDGTYMTCLVARGFQQDEGQHYDNIIANNK